MKLDVKFEENDETIEAVLKDDPEILTMQIIKDNCRLFFDFGEIQEVNTFPEEIDTYEGSYMVTPKIEQQTLETELKVMKDDVTVKGIPYYATSNLSGGDTIYIGKDVEING